MDPRVMGMDPMGVVPAYLGLEWLWTSKKQSLWEKG